MTSWTARDGRIANGSGGGADVARQIAAEGAVGSEGIRVVADREVGGGVSRL